MPRSRFALPALAIALAPGAPCAFAQETPEPETILVPDPTPPPPAIVGSSEELWEPGRWTLQFEPAVWFAAMGGDVRAADGPELEFKDIDGDADHAHSAASLRGLYRKDRLTVMADAMWLDFSEGSPASSLDFTLWSADVSVGWELLEWKRQRFVDGAPRDTGIAARVIPYAGLRVIAPDIGITTGGGDFSGSDEFLQPLVGLRIELEIFDWLSLDTGADLGAFDLLGEDAVAFDWSLGIRAMLTENIAAQIGFRQMFMDVESEDVRLNGSVGGLVAGVTIRF